MVEEEEETDEVNADGHNSNVSLFICSLACLRLCMPALCKQSMMSLRNWSMTSLRNWEL